MQSVPAPSSRARVRRLPDRGAYDRATIDAILDEGLVCHVAFERDGAPFMIPTIYARDGDRVLIHGAVGNRTLRRLDEGVETCLCVTLVDGLVMARSAFHHSLNYRSVILFGRAREISDEDEKQAALRAFVEHVVPGRSEDVRGPNPKEMKQTRVLALPIDEASAKLRAGPPVDEEEDYALPAWAGVLPLTLTTGEPIPDGRLAANTPVPGNIRDWRRGAR